MSCCSTCETDISGNSCGCGCSDCKPFKIPPQCHHCPPPPLIPPCEYRCVDGVRIPVWHPIHPLIPIFKSCYSGAIDTACCEEETDKQLGCFLDQAEELYNTCQLSGDRYYKAIMLRAAAMTEYQKDMELWRSARNAMIVLGKSFTSPKPEMSDGVYGQMLKDLLEGTQNGRFSLGV